jgi:hypothetical protein
MNKIHEEQSELAGKSVKIKETANKLGGETILIEDWWDRVSGGSWMFAEGNPACLQYAMRIGLSKQPVCNDNEVLYGKIGSLGHLVHVSELEEHDDTVLSVMYEKEVS